MKDRHGAILYIGKAGSLRKRVSSYFQKRAVGPRQRILISKIHNEDFIPTHSEAEALIYEASLIKSKHPRYNIELKDDKSYPYLKLTAEEYPRLMISRRRTQDGSKYFGPYTNVKLLKAASGFMRKIFPLRTCNRMPKRVCLLYQIGECLGPCQKKVTKSKYNRVVGELVLFLTGKRTTLIKKLTRRMQLASSSMHYEEAVTLRDKVRALSIATEGGVKISAFDEAEDLRHLLGIRRHLNRIEAFDISNISGKEAVGSLAVFINGRPRKSEYRRFRIKTVTSIDDYAMMKEIVGRRYRRVLAERLPLPDLIIIDGGRGHLNCAYQVLSELGLGKKKIIGIAKEFERIWLLDKDLPLVLHKNSPVLHLVQRIRDEAHRFAHSYFRLLRRKRIVG